jgi:hypothetical protein
MSVLHQFIAYFGIVILASAMTAYVFDVIRLLGKPYPSKTMYWILSGTPYFPVQIGLGLALGWMIGRRVWHWAMLWVWVLPLARLVYAIFAIPTLAPNWIPPAFQAGIGESRWKHYFGWGCGGVRPCFDQNAFTEPFYCAVAYSVGALLARKLRKTPPAIRKDSYLFLSTGIVFLLVGLLELVQTVQQGWKSYYLGIVAMPAAIGAFLVLYAFMLSRRFSAIRTANGTVQ